MQYEVEHIEGKRFITIPVHAGAKTKEILKRINSVLGEYMDHNYRGDGYPGFYGKTRQTRKYPWARLHALFPEKIVYEVEV
jgi:hypothetical protein